MQNCARALALVALTLAAACGDDQGPADAARPDAAPADAASEVSAEIPQSDADTAAPVPELPAEVAPEAGMPADAGDAADTAPTTGFYPCDVEAVLKAKCLICHTSPPAMGAPMSLLEWADMHKGTVSSGGTVKNWQQAAQYVMSGFMPLMGSPNGPLLPEQRAILLPWLQAGAQPAATACTPTDAGGQ